VRARGELRGRGLAGASGALAGAVRRAGEGGARERVRLRRAGEGGARERMRLRRAGEGGARKRCGARERATTRERRAEHEIRH